MNFIEAFKNVRIFLIDLAELHMEHASDECKSEAEKL